MSIDLNRIAERYKKSKKPFNNASFYPIYLYDATFFQIESIGVLFEVLKTKQKKGFKTHEIAKNNYIANLSTSIEMACKALIINNNWNASAYDKLLNEKLTLSEAYEFFGKSKVSRQFIVSHFYTFQSLEAIHKVFSTLLGKDFFNEIEKQSISDNETDDTLKIKIPNWKKELKEIFDIRNAFIHEGKLGSLTRKQIVHYYGIGFYLVAAINNYFTKHGSTIAIMVLKAIPKIVTIKNRD